MPESRCPDCLYGSATGDLIAPCNMHRQRGAMRADVAEDFAAHWWSQNGGETETWNDLDAGGREAVMEHSNADAVAEWFAERMADMEKYVGKIPGHYVELSAEATLACAEEGDRD